MTVHAAEADIEAGDIEEPELPPSGVSAQLLAFVKVFVMLWTAPFRALLGTRQRPPTLVGLASAIGEEEVLPPPSPELPPSPDFPNTADMADAPVYRTPVATPEPLWPAEAAPPGATVDEGVLGC